jgi:mono/diheme cytochrome c family protein
MSRSAWILLLALAATRAASAQTAAVDSPSDAEATGRQLFVQSCGVCHAKPQITARLYGPPLSRESLGGQEILLREFIGNGTARMPGFKYQFRPAQITAIVAYLKTVPAPAAAPPPPAPAAGDRRQAD